MEKKYIVVSTMFSEQIIIFSSVIDHKTVAGNMNVISAGFVDILCTRDKNKHGEYYLKIKTHCYGESKTLKLSSRPKEDSILAEILLKEDYCQ